MTWNGLRTDYTPRLHEIAAPTLFISGEKDSSVPLKYARQAQTLTPHARLAVIPECKHWPMRDKPAEFNRIVADFLRAPAG